MTKRHQYTPFQSTLIKKMSPYAIKRNQTEEKDDQSTHAPYTWCMSQMTSEEKPHLLKLTTFDTFPAITSQVKASTPRGERPRWNLSKGDDQLEKPLKRSTKTSQKMTDGFQMQQSASSLQRNTLKSKPTEARTQRFFKSDRELLRTTCKRYYHSMQPNNLWHCLYLKQL